MTPAPDRLLQAEEAKRQRCWDPAQRLRAIQETVNWAERQLTTPRNGPVECLRRERALLARWPRV